MYKNDNKGSTMIVLLLVIIVICLFLLIYNNIDFKSNDSNMYDLTKKSGGLPYPEQTTCSNEMFTMDVDGTTVTFTKVAKYKIIGRVGSIGYHFGITNVANKMSTRDFQLVFGEIALDKNFNNITFKSTDRYGSWYCDNQDIYKEYGGFDIININVSNNHLIPSTEKIKKEIESVKVGNIVEIEGYLVTSKWNTENGSHYWGTSTTRTDSGNEACETIYVEKFAKLQ